MEFINKSFKIVTALSPILILVVYYFQLKAMSKQNDQNLFKIRLECYTKAFLITDVIIESLQNLDISIWDEESFAKIFKTLENKLFEFKVLLSELTLLFENEFAFCFTDMYRLMFDAQTNIEVTYYGLYTSKEERNKKIIQIAQDVCSEIKKITPKITCLLRDQIKLK